MNQMIPQRPNLQQIINGNNVTISTSYYQTLVSTIAQLEQENKELKGKKDAIQKDNKGEKQGKVQKPVR